MSTKNPAATNTATFDDFGGGKAADDFEGMDFEDEGQDDLGEYDQSSGDAEDKNPGDPTEDDDSETDMDDLELDDDESSDDPDEKKDPANADDGDKGKKKNNLNERFSKLTTQRDEAEAKADQLELENAQLRKKLGLDGDQGKKPAATEEPSEEDFDNYDDYLDALEEFNAQDSNPATKEDEGKEPESNTVAEEFTLAKKSVDRKIERWEEKPADFKEKVYSNDVQITQSMVIAVNEMENPGEALYALASNPKIAAQIAASAPAVPDFSKLTAQQTRQVVAALAEQATAIAELVEKGPGKKADSKAASQRKPKLKTDAPAPITPNKGNASAGSEKDVNDMSLEELDTHMSKQDDPWW